jgi:nucleoside-diphosphate-sugar epimerase
MRALIVGASRGLGEVTAKLVAAGGGTVFMTYAVGKVEAENVAGQIREWGGDVQVLQYDARKAPELQLEALTSPVTHLFYFATNPIFRAKRDLVSMPLLRDFTAFYLQGFHDLCLQMIRPDKPYALTGAKLTAYYPSSVAVEERPAGMTEYAMVKAAGEQMCRDMNQYLPGLSILVSRLPRMRTDQTASMIPERELDPIDVLLPLIRQMRAVA